MHSLRDVSFIQGILRTRFFFYSFLTWYVSEFLVLNILVRVLILNKSFLALVWHFQLFFSRNVMKYLLAHQISVDLQPCFLFFFISSLWTKPHILELRNASKSFYQFFFFFLYTFYRNIISVSSRCSFLYSMTDVFAIRRSDVKK